MDGIYLFTSGVPDQSSDLCHSYIEEACAGRSLKLHVVLFSVDSDDVSVVAVPGRYASTSKTANVLRGLAHSTGGRFHWFRENGELRLKSSYYIFHILNLFIFFPLGNCWLSIQIY